MRQQQTITPDMSMLLRTGFTNTLCYLCGLLLMKNERSVTKIDTR